MWNGELAMTFLGFSCGTGLAAWMFWLEKHPRRDLRPRLLPTTLIMLVGGLVALGAAVHLLALAGVQLPSKTP